MLTASRSRRIEHAFALYLSLIISSLHCETHSLDNARIKFDGALSAGRSNKRAARSVAVEMRNITCAVGFPFARENG